MKGGKNSETFIVRIMNRQNSTWQGSVTWVDKQETQNFRSALELVKMIDGALDSAVCSEQENKPEEGEESHEE